MNVFEYGNRSGFDLTWLADTDAAGMIHGLDDETVLCGPEGNPQDVVVDQVMGKKFGAVLADLSEQIGVAISTSGMPQHAGSRIRAWTRDRVEGGEVLMRLDNHGIIVPIVDGSGLELGLMAVMGDDMDGYSIRGLLFGSDLVVDPLYRNMGIGRCLVAASLLYRGGLPTWDHDKPSYSPAGETCVRSGLQLAQRMLPEQQLANEVSQP